MATKATKKNNPVKSKNSKGSETKTLTILPTKGFAHFMADMALITMMFAGTGLLGAMAFDMILHAFSKITIVVDK